MHSSQGLIKCSKIALAALGILLILSVIFFKERVFFADASYVLFDILNYKKFAIQEHRYGSFITQIVPYLGAKLHLPIRALVFSYAVIFNRYIRLGRIVSG
jgi:phosphate starvation-inducible membrane PsiE